MCVFPDMNITSIDVSVKYFVDMKKICRNCDCKRTVFLVAYQTNIRLAIYDFQCWCIFYITQLIFLMSCLFNKICTLSTYWCFAHTFQHIQVLQRCHVKVVHKKACFYFLVQYTRKYIIFTHLSHKPIKLCVNYSKRKKMILGINHRGHVITLKRKKHRDQ